MTGPTPTGLSWVLRSPCGCPHGASMLSLTEDQAWRELANWKPSKLARMVAEGWRLTQEPNETAVPDVRARFGKCTHVGGAQ